MGNRTDYHEDESAAVDDTRISVEETAVGIKIIREEYRLTKYDKPDRYYGWKQEDEFKIHASNITDLAEALDGVDTERLLESVEKLQELNDALSGGNQ